MLARTNPGPQYIQGFTTVGTKIQSQAREIKKMPTQVHISPAVNNNQFFGKPGLSCFKNSIPYLYHWFSDLNLIVIKKIVYLFC